MIVARIIWPGFERFSDPMRWAVFMLYPARIAAWAALSSISWIHIRLFLHTEVFSGFRIRWFQQFFIVIDMNRSLILHGILLYKMCAQHHSPLRLPEVLQFHYPWFKNSHFVFVTFYSLYAEGTNQNQKDWKACNYHYLTRWTQNLFKSSDWNIKG